MLRRWHIWVSALCTARDILPGQRPGTCCPVRGTREDRRNQLPHSPPARRVRGAGARAGRCGDEVTAPARNAYRSLVRYSGHMRSARLLLT